MVSISIWKDSSRGGAYVPHASRAEKRPGGEHIHRLAEDMRTASGSGVERVVDETVGELVVLPANGRVRDGAKVAREAGCLERKTA